MWIQGLIAILKTIAATLGLVEKALPSPELKAEMYKDSKPLMEVKQRIKREKKIFNSVKNIPDANIESAVREYTDMNEEDTQLLITNVTNRVKEYRRDFPVISGWRRFEKSLKK